MLIAKLKIHMYPHKYKRCHKNHNNKKRYKFQKFIQREQQSTTTTTTTTKTRRTDEKSMALYAELFITRTQIHQ